MDLTKFKIYPFQYIPNFYNLRDFLEKIKNQVNFKEDKIIIGENNIERIERRKTSWLSNRKDLTFEYSGKIMNPEPIPELFNEIMNMIYKYFGIKYDGILVNYYEDGNVGMGYHSDPVNDKWDSNFIIFSLGDDRKLIFREKDNKEIKTEYHLKDGDLLYMFDNCQEKYEHSLRKKSDGEERISLVFKKRKL